MVAVVPDAAGDGDDDVRQASRRSVAAVGLLERRWRRRKTGRCPCCTAGRAGRRSRCPCRPSRTPRRRAADGDVGGGAVVAAVAPVRDTRTQPRTLASRSAAVHTALPVHGRAAGGPGRAAADRGRSRAAPAAASVSELDTHDEGPSPGGTLTDTHPKVVRVDEDGHREGAGRMHGARRTVRGRGPGPRVGPGRSAALVGAGSATTAVRAVGANSPGKQASSRRVRASAYVARATGPTANGHRRPLDVTASAMRHIGTDQSRRFDGRGGRTVRRVPVPALVPVSLLCGSLLLHVRGWRGQSDDPDGALPPAPTGRHRGGGQRDQRARHVEPGVRGAGDQPGTRCTAAARR